MQQTWTSSIVAGPKNTQLLECCERHVPGAHMYMYMFIAALCVSSSVSLSPFVSCSVIFQHSGAYCTANWFDEIKGFTHEAGIEYGPLRTSSNSLKGNLHFVACQEGQFWEGQQPEMSDRSYQVEKGGWPFVHVCPYECTHIYIHTYIYIHRKKIMYNERDYGWQAF